MVEQYRTFQEPSLRLLAQTPIPIESASISDTVRRATGERASAVCSFEPDAYS